MPSVVIPSYEDSSTTAEALSEFSLSLSEIGGYLLFFDKIGYYSGFREPSVLIRFGEPFKLKCPDDPALSNADRPLLVSFFTSNPAETIADAMAIQIRQGFTSAPAENWLYHPKYFVSQSSFKASAGKLSPEVGLTFLEGLWCPPDNTPLDDVIDFREKRRPERDAFLDALLKVSEGVFVENHGLAFSVPVERVERALAELNRTIVERWASSVRKSFRFGIRVNKSTLNKLSAAAMIYEATGNLYPTLLTALSGLIELDLSLTPRVERPDDFTKAISFAWDAKQRFPNAEQYSRYRLKRA